MGHQTRHLRTSHSELSPSQVVRRKGTPIIWVRSVGRRPEIQVSCQRRKCPIPSARWHMTLAIHAVEAISAAPIRKTGKVDGHACREKHRESRSAAPSFIIIMTTYLLPPYYFVRIFYRCEGTLGSLWVVYIPASRSWWGCGLRKLLDIMLTETAVLCGQGLFWWGAAWIRPRA